MKKENLNIEITELFMAQADRDRRFYGTIKRERDDNNNKIVRGKIFMKKTGVIYSATNGDQDVLGAKLDEMTILILDGKIHRVKPQKVKNPTIGSTDFFLN